MVLKEKAWIALFIVAVLLIIGAGCLPYFPGDVAMSRFIQWITPVSTGWAQLISATAKFPSDIFLIALTAGLSWWVAGWRAALLALASFVGMWVLGKALGPVIGRPRPSPELVHVVKKLSGYSFPSIFGLTYASTIGFIAVLFNRKASGVLRNIVIIICSLLLLAGWTARIALGAHWPSDVILSYMIGFLWVYFLVRYT